MPYKKLKKIGNPVLRIFTLYRRTPPLPLLIGISVAIGSLSNRGSCIPTLSDQFSLRNSLSSHFSPCQLKFQVNFFLLNSLSSYFFPPKLTFKALLSLLTHALTSLSLSKHFSPSSPLPDSLLNLSSPAKLQRHNIDNSKQIFPEKELRGLSPYFNIHVSVRYLYIPRIDLPILLQENMWTDPGIV